MPKPSQKTINAAVSVNALDVTLAGTPIIRDVTFNVPVGSLTAIVGPNGSGKTTLVRAMLGLTPATGGTVRFFGQPLRHMRTDIGYVPQRFDFDRDMPITVREFLHLARRTETPVSHVIHTLKEVGLSPNMLDKRLGTLSGGQLQRVLIAQAILNNPAILVLDEPTAGIDVAGEATLTQVLDHLRAEHGTTIIIISHDLHMIAASVDYVVCINRRLVCAGPPKKTLTTAHLAELYGRDMTHIDHPHN